MSSQKYKRPLTDVMKNAYLYIIHLQQAIELMQKDNIEGQNTGAINATAEVVQMINDIIHPAHRTTQHMLKDIHPSVIQFCIERHDNLVKAPAAQKGEKCWCNECSQVVKASDDNQSDNGR